MKKRLIALVLALALMALPALAEGYAAMLERAEEYIAQGETDKALAALQLARQVDPAAPEAYLSEAELWVSLGDLAQARACIDVALGNDPVNADAWLMRCRLDAAEGEMDALEQDLLYAEVCGADIGFIAPELAMTLAAKGRYGTALPFFEMMDIDAMDDAQCVAYGRALTAAGRREEAVALGLIAPAGEGAADDSALDALFEGEALRLVPLAPKDLDLEIEITDQLLQGLGDLAPSDLSGLVSEVAAAMSGEDAHILSMSPTGDSGLLRVNSVPLAWYDGKCRAVWPGERLGVEDSYGNLKTMYERYLCSGGINLAIGEEGLVYSPEGRYAALLNYIMVAARMQFIVDPMVIDLATGELFLLATSPSKLKKAGFSSVTAACFSEDGSALYCVLYGDLGEDVYSSLYRYDLATGEAVHCCDLTTESAPLIYPHLALLSDGSLAAVYSCARNSDPTGLVRFSPAEDGWTAQEYHFLLSRNLWPFNRMDYAASGDALVLGRSGEYPYLPNGLCVFRPEDGGAGMERLLLVESETNTVVSMTAEEYLAMLEPDGNGRPTVREYSLPYSGTVAACLSPGGRYALLRTMNPMNDVPHLLLVRLDDLSVREITEVEGEEDPANKVLRMTHGMRWDGDALVFHMAGGRVRTFRLSN